MKKNLIIFKRGAWFRMFTLLLLTIPAALFGQIKITGTVTDATDGSPLPGAGIVILGTTTGVVSDANGAYVIEAPADGTLIISYMGYLAETIAIEGRTKVDVVLTPDLTKLDEVVVIGYGTMKKSDLTGAVSSVKEEDIKGIKSSNAVEALQGKVAGVDMTRSDGRAGSGYSILIRGARSFSADNDPIYIVDGVDYGSNININPNDIASMEVLKDASSTAIYGSRGANGIILITTKKGSQGKINVTFNTYYGYTTPLGKIPMGDADYYLQMTRDMYRTTHPADWATPDEDIPVETLLFPEEIEGYNNGTDFDWVGEQMKDHGNQMDYYLSISGGSEKTNYAVSLNHFKEDNFIPNDNYKRYSIKTNIDSKIRKWLEIGNSTFLSYTLLNRGEGINYNFIPLVEPYDSLGNLIIEPNSRVPFTNMLFDQDPAFRSNETNRTGIFTSFYGQLNLLPGLNFRSTFNVNLDFQRVGDYSGNGGILERQSTATLLIDNSYKWTWTNVLTYDKTLGTDHHIMATAATETRYNLKERYYQASQNMLLADFKWFGIRTGDRLQTSIIDPSKDNPYPFVESTMVSFIGRLHYGYKGKYLATVTGRYDGASQLVEKWDFFPAISVAWKISEEEFMKGIEPVSNLKLRFGIGQTGNSSVDPYGSMGITTDYQMYYQFGVTENTIKGFRTGQISTFPKWESNTAGNIGLDFGLFRNRISGSIELYSVHTYDILQEVTLPPTSAVGSVLENIGETKGKGVEVTLNTVNVNTSDFKWSTNLTFARSTEEITYLSGGVTQDVANKWFVGEPLAVHYDWKKIGIWQTEEAEEATRFGALPGDLKLQNTVATTYVINDSDRVVLGTPRPKWTGGLNSTMNYKNIDFSFFVYARVGQMISDAVEGSMWSPDGRENSVERDYWTPNNPTNEYPRVNPGLTRSGWAQATTLRYKDGSFVKVKDITLGYTLPASITSKIAMSNFRVYVSAKNYLVFGKYFAQGRYDPEGGGNASYPAPKMLIVGASVTF